MKLSQKEKEEIFKCLDTNKPIPENYRFKLFSDNRQVELLWLDKNPEISNVVMPFQKIEHIDEPRKEKQSNLEDFGVDEKGRQLKGWTNKLIWGDNKFILSSLKNGPIFEEIKKQGGIKLIYIDPPFDVGADFSMKIEVGDEEYEKKASVLEELAYRDTWGKGMDSFIAMIYERLKLMKELLAEDGSIYVHCDWRVNSYIRLIMDEIFGKDNFRNEIIWYYPQSIKASTKKFLSNHDCLFLYSRFKENFLYNSQEEPYSEKQLERFKHYDENGKFYYDTRRDKNNNKIQVKVYLKKTGTPVSDMWYFNRTQGNEYLEYPTQKPEKLLERVIKASSNEGDLICDFFAGSGTTLAVAEKLNRKWIGSDLGKFSIHTIRKRMIKVQRELKEENKNYRAFEIMNLGKYERSHFIGVNLDLNDEKQKKQLEDREENFINLIVNAYKGVRVDGFKTIQAKKQDRLVNIGPVNLPVSQRHVKEVLNELIERKFTKADILAFEFDFGIEDILKEAKREGIDLSLKKIPPQVFDKRAIENDDVVFYDLNYIEANLDKKENKVSVELTDFVSFFSDESENKIKNLKPNGSSICIREGKILKIFKDSNGVEKQEILTKSWSDWIDYWSVDFNYESRKEIIQKWKSIEVEGKKDLTELQNYRTEIIEEETGNFIFENEWQSFRTKKNKKLELKTPFYNCGKKIAIRVVDILGNDTTIVKEIE